MRLDLVYHPTSDLLSYVCPSPAHRHQTCRPAKVAKGHVTSVAVGPCGPSPLKSICRSSLVPLGLLVWPVGLLGLARSTTTTASSASFAWRVPLCRLGEGELASSCGDDEGSDVASLALSYSTCNAIVKQQSTSDSHVCQACCMHEGCLHGFRSQACAAGSAKGDSYFCVMAGVTRQNLVCACMESWIFIARHVLKTAPR